MASKRKFRPMGFGDILDEAFDLYRNNFILFVGIAGVVYVPLYFVYGASNGYMQSLGPSPWSTQVPPGDFGGPDITAMGLSIGVMFLTLLALMIAYPLVTGAVTHAISQRYLGEQTTIKHSYMVVKHRFWQLLGTGLLFSLLAGGIMTVAVISFAVMIGIGAAIMSSGDSSTVIGAILFILGVLLAIPLTILAAYFVFRFIFAFTTCVVENRNYGKALSRSWQLSDKHGWRVLGILIIIYLIITFVSAPLTLFSSLISFIPYIGPIIAGVVYALLETVVTPMASIVVVLLYYDLRIRKEGFDLQMLARDMGVPVSEHIIEQSSQVQYDYASASPASAQPTQTYDAPVYNRPVCECCYSEVGIDEEAVVCTACGKTVHAKCWRTTGGCATPGCPGAGSAAPKNSPN
ncbi:MAG TPA: hypothetical protein PLU88_00330 [Armatimonadota bacterium]|nr:hypothetical protein [Armatimonadota bacterium]